MERIRIVSKEE